MNCSLPGALGGNGGGGASVTTDAVEITTVERSKLAALSFTVISSDDVSPSSLDDIEMVSSKVLTSTMNSTFTAPSEVKSFLRRIVDVTSVTLMIVTTFGDTYKYAPMPSLNCSCSAEPNVSTEYPSNLTSALTAA